MDWCEYMQFFKAGQGERILQSLNARKGRNVLIHMSSRRPRNISGNYSIKYFVLYEPKP